MTEILRSRIVTQGALFAVCVCAALPAAGQEPSTTGGVATLPPQKAMKLVVKQEAPEYPPLAKLNFIQGPVRMIVRVSSDGKVSEAHIVVGHPFLAIAALEAIRGWLYRPARSRPGPAQFQTIVDMNFSLRFKKFEHLPPQPDLDLLRQIHPPELVEKPPVASASATVRMRLLLDPKGHIVDSLPLTGHAPETEEARENISNWKFRPAHWGALAVPWYLDVDAPVHTWRASQMAADPGGQ